MKTCLLVKRGSGLGFITLLPQGFEELELGAVELTGKYSQSEYRFFIFNEHMEIVFGVKPSEVELWENLSETYFRAEQDHFEIEVVSPAKIAYSLQA